MQPMAGRPDTAAAIRGSSSWHCGTMDGHSSRACTCCHAAGSRWFRVLTSQLAPGGTSSSASQTQCAAASAGRLRASGASGSWSRWERVKARIDTGEVILMDGGTGTEVERRVKAAGDPTAVNQSGWSCAQALLHPEVCQEVAAEYLRTGCEIVIANTYASNRMILEVAGYGNETAKTNANACVLLKNDDFLWEE